MRFGRGAPWQLRDALPGARAWDAAGSRVPGRNRGAPFPEPGSAGLDRRAQGPIAYGRARPKRAFEEFLRPRADKPPPVIILD